MAINSDSDKLRELLDAKIAKRSLSLNLVLLLESQKLFCICVSDE